MQVFSIDAGELERSARRSEPEPDDAAASRGPLSKASDADPIGRHVDAIYRFARTLGADRELAADLTQEAFVVAWRKGKHDLPPGALATFLRKSVRFLWLQTRRSDRRAEAAIAALTEQRWVERTALADGGHEPDSEDALVAAARRCVARLEGRAARAVQLSYGEGRGRAEIATTLGLAQNGVKTLLARTRRWLAACIRQSLGDD